MVQCMKVLAALDFGEPALEALRQARALAHELGGTLSACHVLPTVHDFATLFPERGLGTMDDTATEDAKVRSELAALARSKLGLELTEIFVERGAPYAELVRRADAIGADFIAIGSHGRTGLSRAVLGSVAERVVRHAHCSVLVARPVVKAGIVLAASDLSEPSVPAIAAGAAAARRSGAKLVVVSALEWQGDLSSLAFGLLGALPALPSNELQQQTRELLHSTIELAIKSVGADGEARVLDGAPASAIVACAEELQAELVVVGSRGRTGLARLALGSVAEAVIRNASCSVLAVRL